MSAVPVGEGKASNNEGRESAWHPNRAYIQLNNGIVLDSCFPGGNIANATLTNNTPVTIQLEGNTDISLDNNSKYWLYFRIRGYRKDRPIKFILKNANHLRKYYGQPRYKPYLAFKEDEDDWQPMSTPIDMNILEGGQFQGSCLFLSEKFSREKKINRSTNDLYPQRDEKITTTTGGTEDNRRGSCYFAVYYPYSYQDLNSFLLKEKIKHQTTDQLSQPLNRPYFHEQTIAYTFERRKISLVTITAASNIESVAEKEPTISFEIFPNAQDRPFKLKNNPVIIFTARVHPSETSSSFFIEGIIQFLLSNCRAACVLREMFIFQIIPMLNPDGVQHGNFRFDHELRNLNRYYGQSSIEKTQLTAAELLIDYYKNCNNEQSQFTEFYEETYSRLFMYVDVHGHNSALPSFIYGNHTEKIEHAIENKMFCKLIESNFVPNGFSKNQSEFSKKNMTLQEKYDEFSKLCSGRVFAGRMPNQEANVFHSYTLEVLPYWQEFPRRKNDQKTEKLSATDYAKLLGKTFLLSLLDLLDLNPESKLSEFQLDKMRKMITKECLMQQSRRAFLFKRAESVNERNSYSELSKPKAATIDRQYMHYQEYILRWFTNQQFISHFFSKNNLLKEAKFYKFYQKIAKLLQVPMPPELCESPRKERPQKMKTVESQPKGETKHTPICLSNEKSRTSIIKEQKKLLHDEKIIFICRGKEKNKVEGKINKQTIQLRDDFLDLLTKHKTVEKDTDVRYISRKEVHIKKQYIQREISESTERYDRQIANKVNNPKNNAPKKAAFEVRAKEMIPKQKMIRVQTETITSEHNIGEISPSQLQSSNSMVANIANRQKPTSVKEVQMMNCYARPSFIEEFMMKIREERESMNIFPYKPSNRDELKQKALKIRPSLKETLDEQQRNMLPVLRRNKIFTMVSDTSSPEYLQGRGYESILQHKKRVLTVEQQSNLDETVLKTKKILAAHKKDEIIREQMKKSQRIDYKC